MREFTRRESDFSESRRLQALQRYGASDTLPDAIFDCITAAASQVCETPIAGISLIDSDRVWFLSCSGIAATETPRDLAFCSHAIANPGVLTEIPDAIQDLRFKNSPLFVGDSKVRFYAGKPLYTSDGYALGALCVLGSEPKSLTTFQRSALNHLAGLVTLLLEYRLNSSESLTGCLAEGKLPDGIVLTDARRSDHPITFCSRGFEELTGYSLSEICGKNCRFLQGKDTDLDKVRSMGQAIEDKKQATTVLKNYRKDGSEFWNEVTILPITDSAGILSYCLGFQYDVSASAATQETYTGNHEELLKSIDLHSELGEALANTNSILLREISQRKHIELQSMKLQEELMHIGRLSTMGEMATGLAHEMSQPLLVISQCADTALLVAQENASCDPVLLECINDIQAETQRAGEIIRSLRHFISREASVRCAVDINELAGQSVRLIRSDSRVVNIPIHLEVSNIPQLIVDRVQIAQVLVNLLRNSVDAIASAADSGGWEVQHAVSIKTLLEGDQVLVTITDTGPGFEPGIDPFKAFETSKEGGLGVGLSICRSIIESHGGALWIDEHRERGSRLLFTLPVESTAQNEEFDS